jgi:cell division protein FtsZ
VASRENAQDERARSNAKDGLVGEREREMANPSGRRRPDSRHLPPASESISQQAEQMATKQGRPRRKTGGTQMPLPLETIGKGRFDKSEPTVLHGEDLDVPTYIRRGMALN